jgi:hypothetical protein
MDEAGLSLNPSLGDRALARFGPLPGAVLLLSPDERQAGE